MASRATPPAVLRLAYRATHPAARPAHGGGNVYISHGLLGNAMNWSTVAQRLVRHAALQDKLRTVFALDLRNHGGSPHSADHSSDALASDLELFALDPPTAAADGCAAVGRSVLVGHSMGGLAVMSTLLRRYNENTVLAEAGSETNYGAWSAVERARCAQMMRAVNAACEIDTQLPLRDLLYCDAAHSAPARDEAVAAAVIVDMTPTALLDAQDSLSVTTMHTLHAMQRVDLKVVRTHDDIKRELERAGIADADMRNFVATNVVLRKGQPAAWRCNLDALAQKQAPFQPSIVRWFESARVDAAVTAPAPCTLPVLFVFGGQSEYNNESHRARLADYFPNATQVVVPGAGHFVHYEKVDAFVDAVAPFLAQHMS